MKKFSQDNKVNQLIKKLVSQGWRYNRRRKHGSIISPSEKMYIVPLTPSDKRAFYNFRSDIRKDQIWSMI